MNMKAERMTDQKSNIFNFISCLFGIAFFAIGAVNTFWGNDPGFGVFVVLLSLVYFPPMNAIFTKKTGLSIPAFLKILLGVFIIWAALGVGELFDKIDMMMTELNAA
jgi:hypothetical protein